VDRTKALISCPSSDSLRTRWPPIKPEEPVTRNFTLRKHMKKTDKCKAITKLKFSLSPVFILYIIISYDKRRLK